MVIEILSTEQNNQNAGGHVSLETQILERLFE